MSVAVIGNPKVHSRTRHAAELVIAAMTGSPPETVIELSELGPGLLGWEIPPWPRRSGTFSTPVSCW